MPAIGDAFKKLDPRLMIKNPVMFAVYLGSILTTILWIRSLGAATGESSGFILGVGVWLWFTVLFANFAEAVAEGHGKAQAASLRKSRTQVVARRIVDRRSRTTEETPAPDLKPDDLVFVRAGEVIPADGEVVEGAASVDESAITGESAPVVRESGGDRSAVTGGTKVISDWLVIRVTTLPGQSFLDRMIAMVEGAKRRKTPNEIALAILLAALTLIFLLVVATLLPYSQFGVEASGQGAGDLEQHGGALFEEFFRVVDDVGADLGSGAHRRRGGAAEQGGHFAHHGAGLVDRGDRHVAAQHFEAAGAQHEQPGRPALGDQRRAGGEVGGLELAQMLQDRRHEPPNAAAVP